MPGPDPAHWLHRLTAPEWLAAAGTELAHAEAALNRHASRAAVTHARRAAGMAWNAVLINHPNERAGRSYMEHVVALSEDPTTPEAVRAAARLLRESPSVPPALIKLAAPGPVPESRLVRAAMQIIEHATRVVSPS